LLQPTSPLRKKKDIDEACKLFEKNKPAAFKDPVKAKIADWLMLFDIIRGKITF
jgi:CMP-N-acetylneuraminic acid synthetase